MTTAVTTDHTTPLDDAGSASLPVTDREIDDALDDSFPASDPPSWWAGTDGAAG